MVVIILMVDFRKEKREPSWHIYIFVLLLRK